MNWNFFKNQLKKETHEREQAEEMDFDGLWNAIEPAVDELNKKDKKRRYLFFWILFFGFFIAGSCLFFIFQNKKQTTSNTVSNSKIIQQQPKVKEIDLSKTKTSFNKEISETPLLNITNQKNDNNENTKIALDRFSNKKENKDFSISSFTNSTETKRETENNELGKTSLEIKTIDVSTDLGDYFSQKKTETNNLSLTNTLQERKIKDVNVLFLPRLSIPFLQNKNTLSALDFLRDSSQVTDSIKWITGVGNSDVDSNIDRKSIQFSLGILGGASFVDRTLSAKNDVASELLEFRLTHEKPLEVSHIGVLFGVEYKGFRFSTGLQQSIITEKYEFKGSIVVEEDIMGITVFRVNVHGELIPINGLVTQTTSTEYNKRIFNTYRLIDIPLLLAYQRNLDKWKIGVEAGIFANLSHRTDGIISDELLQDVSNRGPIEIFKSKVGVSYQLGLSFARPIFKKWEFHISPSIRYFPNDFTVATYDISQRYIFGGGNIGLRYRLQ